LHCGAQLGRGAAIGFGDVDSLGRFRSVRTTVNTTVKISDPIFQIQFIVVPCHFVDSYGSVLLQIEEGSVQQVFVDVMQQRCELQLAIIASCLTHTGQPERPALIPARSPGQTVLISVPLS
jgi:hypothetical protein